jgi:uncharacterized protein YbbC (DUF1343 family)
MKTTIGLDCLLQDPSRLRGRRVALVANSASVDAQFRYTWDAIASLSDVKLVSILAPQHGLFGQQQANMIESQHRRHSRLNIPIYSLYSETRQPTDAMLEGVDLLVIDLQDVGTRVYTFAWTILACLQAASKKGLEVWILDRPNPIGGLVAEGPLLDRQYKSFVGMESIPMRHGLTLGELANFCKRQSRIDVHLEVVPSQSWDRSRMYDQTGLPWLPPSPNIPTWNSALVYPGQVLLEGTNISEGRGTTRPFECAGAPFMDGELLASRLNTKFRLAGIHFRPIQFVPTFDKYAGIECGGVFWHVTDSIRFRSLECTVAMLMSIKSLWPEAFSWLPPPYEYEFKKMPIDILWGSDSLRHAIDGIDCEDSDLMKSLCRLDETAWFDSLPGLCRLY